ncbi:hypothetical protein A2U01_0072538, partial [Trifolium medium]|nr:hypothetical protein [Trifolium medium]
MIKNPLIIIELKSNPKEEKKAPNSAIFINNKTLQDRELIFQKLFPAEIKEDEGDIVGSSSKKLKMTEKK